MSEDGKMLDKPQTLVDILTTLFNCPLVAFPKDRNNSKTRGITFDSLLSVITDETKRRYEFEATGSLYFIVIPLLIKT